MQSEVAQKIGMSDSVYKNIEEGFTQHIPKEMVEKLAQFYDVPVTDFLDEFNQFLYDGQARRIRAYREAMGLGRKPFARKTGIPIRSLEVWEGEKKIISYKSWKKYFKGKV